MSSSDIAKAYIEAKARLEKALKSASEYGEIVGFVSRFTPSRVDESSPLIQFDVDPYQYFLKFDSIAATGTYLAVIDVKSGHVISLRVKGVERRDIMAEIGVPDSSGLTPKLDASGLITRARVKAEPLLAWNPETDEIKAATCVIEPQSPVIKPKPEVLEKILGLPSEGVVLGSLTMAEEVVEGAKVRLPLKAFYQHILVLGTTGSGKTTFMKNLIVSLLNMKEYSIKPFNMKPTVIVIDSTRDYVHMMLDRLWEETPNINLEHETKLARTIYGDIEPPSKVTVIVPVTKILIGKLHEYSKNKGITIRDSITAFEMLARYYFEVTYSRVITDILLGSIDEVEVKISGYQPRRIATLKVKYQVRGRSREIIINILPYAFRFTEVKGSELAELNPFLTSQARDQLPRIILAFERHNIKINTLKDLIDLLRESVRGKRERRGLEEKSPLSDIIYHELGIHKGTVENIIRNLGVLDDSGIFDVILGNEYVYEPDLNWLLEQSPGNLIILDLEFLREHTPIMAGNVESIVALRMLHRAFKWKMTKYAQRERSQPVIVVVDEAHRFFPAVGGGEGEYVVQVANMLASIARLGRARGLGIIFATHSPKDVHDIVLQLTNTKVIFRMDPALVDRLDLPSEYKRFIVRVSDRVAIVKSHMLRLSYVTIKTPLPLAGHFDLSAL